MMMDLKFVKDLIEGENVTLQLLVNSVNKGIDSMGNQYLSVELKDNSGTIPGKKWNFKNDEEAIYQTGNVILVSGDVKKFKDSLQLIIKNAEVVPLKEVDSIRFIKHSPYSKEELMKNFNSLVSSIKNDDCLKVINYFVDKHKDKFFDYPAAVSVHHDYLSGLLTHSVFMANIADYLSHIYKDINRDLLVTGCLIHDLGKLKELEGPIIFHYSLEGKLLGHISILMGEIAVMKEKLNLHSETILLLEHMILSHHGELEYGSPVLPLTKEALLLSMIDNFDSKMVIVDKALENVKNGEYTQKIFPLDGRIFYKPFE